MGCSATTNTEHFLLKGEKMNTLELQEQLQENLRTYLDGMNDELLDGICQVVVDTFHTALETKYSVPKGWTGTVVR